MRKISRRSFLKAATVACALTALTACGGGDVLGTEHGQQAEGLGNTHLHRTVGERLQRHAEHHIESCDHSAAGQFADSEILIHNNTPADEF